MKRLILISMFFLFFASCQNNKESGEKPEDAKKQQVRMFWETFNRATSLRTGGKFEEAVVLYEKALQYDPHHEESLYYLGSCQLELGDYAQAVNTYRRLLDLNPQSNRTVSQLGLLLSTPAPGAVINEEEAKVLFQKGSSINQEESGPFLRLGLLALRQNDFVTAWKQFQTAAGFNSPEGVFFSGFVRYQQGQYQEAASFFQRVLEMNRHEKKISGRGVFSEGDIKTSGSALSFIEKAGVKALMFLYWSSVKLGEYPQIVPPEFRVHLRKPESAIDIRKLLFPGHALWCNLDSSPSPELVIVDSDGARIFRNVSGKLQESTRLPRGGYGSICGDYDGDGANDLYVISNGMMGQGQNVLYRNGSGAEFRNVSEPAGLKGIRATTTATFVDLDEDSDQDLIEAGNSSGNTAPLRIYRNEQGKFILEPVPFPGNAVSLAIADFNQDGARDLFVLRWKRPAILFQNDGKGHLTDVTSKAGLPLIAGNRFSAVFFDFNHDRWPDLFVSRYASYESSLLCMLQPEAQLTSESPQLFVNYAGKFTDVSAASGLQHAYGTMTVIPYDVNRDGWTDLVLANGGLEPWRLDRSMILRNASGKELVEWDRFSNQPANYRSFSIVDLNSDNLPEFYGE